MNETRVRLYEQLIEAQERIAQSRYAHGVPHTEVLAAMDEAESVPSDEERAQDLYLATLSAYVHALGGRLEIHAVFPEETVRIKRPRP